MARERFERRVAVQPAGRAQVGQGFRDLQSTLRAFTNQQLGEVRVRAAESARLEGEEFGLAQPLAELAEPITETDRVFFEAAIQAQKTSLAVEIRDNILRIKDDALNPATFNENSLFEFQQSITSYAEALTNQTPPALQNYAENVFSQYAETSQSEVAKEVSELTRRRTLSNLNESVIKLTRDGENASFDGDEISASGFKNEIDDALSAARDAGLITAQSYSNQIASVRNSFKENFILGGFDRALQAGEVEARTYIDRFVKSEELKTDFSPAERFSLESKMESRLNAHRNRNKINDFTLRQDTRDDLTRIRSGLSPNPEIRERLLASGNFESVVKYDRDVEIALGISAVHEQVRYASFIEQDAILSRIEPSPDEENFAVKKAIFDEAVKIVERIRNEIISDPVGYIESLPEIQQQIETAILQGGNIDQIKINALKAMGLPDDQLRVLSNRDAGLIINALNDMSIPEQIDRLREIAINHGTRSTIAFKDLRRQGYPMAVLNLLSMESNPNSQSQQGVAAQAFSADLSELRKAVQARGIKLSSVTDRVNKELDTYNSTVWSSQGDVVSPLNEISDYVTRFALQILATQPGIKPKEAARTATDAFINNHFNYPNVNGINFRVPQIIGNSDARSAGLSMVLLASSGERYVIPDNFFPGVGEDKRTSLYQDFIFNNGQVVTSPDNQRLILTDDSGNPVKIVNEEGSELIVTVPIGDINDDQSPINQITDIRRQIELEQGASRAVGGAVSPRLQQQAIKSQKRIIEFVTGAQDKNLISLWSDLLDEAGQ